MALRLTTVAPRAVLIGVLAVLVLAAGTYAADQAIIGSPTAPVAQPVVPVTLVVPDVRKQAFVFAKGALGDAGFAWRVAGPVHGYAANTVVAQSPAPGTKLIDTGLPVIVLTLAKNRAYGQKGAPEDVSVYGGTAIRLADAAVASVPAPATPSSASGESATPMPAAPTTTPAAAAPAPAPAAPKPAAKISPQRRPAAFTISGAPKEPLDEIPLPDRARLLGAWLAKHPEPTSATVRHFLYQNEWIVTGAKFGWWRGAEALKILAGVDRRAQSLWGVGARSESVVIAALTEVKAR
jgi:hypothetical protein